MVTQVLSSLKSEGNKILLLGINLACKSEMYLWHKYVLKFVILLMRQS